MADDMQPLINEQAEFRGYVDAHLKPLLRTFVSNYYSLETNRKCWRLCDMWFTAFLINSKARYLWGYRDGGHELHMKALRQWHYSLLRNEAIEGFHEQFKLQHDVPARVDDAEVILATLVAGRRAALQSGRLQHTQFDTLVVETDSHLLSEKRCKTYTLYCLWLTFIVQCDCKELYQHLMNFHDIVTCHWFDSVNTDPAGVFVDRANAWFLRKTDCGQLLQYAGLQRELAGNMCADEHEEQEGKARRHACGTQASITLNPYLVDQSSGRPDHGSLAGRQIRRTYGHSKPSIHTQSLLFVLPREVVFWPSLQG
jgi:hypothetical protein